MNRAKTLTLAVLGLLVQLVVICAIAAQEFSGFENSFEVESFSFEVGTQPKKGLPRRDSVQLVERPNQAQLNDAHRSPANTKRAVPPERNEPEKPEFGRNRQPIRRIARLSASEPDSTMRSKPVLKKFPPSSPDQPVDFPLRHVPRPDEPELPSDLAAGPKPSPALTALLRVSAAEFVDEPDGGTDTIAPSPKLQMAAPEPLIYEITDEVHYHGPVPPAPGNTVSAIDLDPDSGQPAIIFRPAVPGYDGSGRPVLRPDVRLSGDPEIAVGPAMTPVPNVPRQAAPLDPQLNPANDSPSLIAVVEPILDKTQQQMCCAIRPLLNLKRRLAVAGSGDIGVGRERLSNALFEIATAKPLNHFGFRVDSGFDVEFPDRAEFFWSSRRGFDPSVDYQDLRFTMENGGEKFSIATQLPLRFLDPTEGGNTGGLGDLQLTAKAVLVDGTSWQVTQFTRTHLNTGSVTHGLGTGHVSMEPGLLFRYKWDEITYLHSEVRFWFPIGGAPRMTGGFSSGEVLRYGLGVSRVLYENDSFAAIPTFEVVRWSVLNGAKSEGTAIPANVDGDGITNLYPGVRFVFDNGGDFGLFELGIGGGFAVTTQHWYDSIFRADLRWSF